MSRLVGMSAAWFLVFALSAVPNEVAAQGWSVDAYAGRAKYELLPGSATSDTGVLGIRFNQDRRFFQAALGLPFSGTDVTWGVLGVGDRLAIRRGGFLAGADISLLAHAQKDPVADTKGQGLLAELLPTISQSLGAGMLEIRSGPRWYGSRIGDADWTRTLWTTEARGGIQAGERLWLESDLRHDRTGDSEAYTRVGFSAAAMLGQAVLEGSLGRWIDGTENAEPEWGVSLAIPIGPSVWLFTSAERESFNPQFLSAPRTSWGAGVTFRLGGARTPAPARPAMDPEGQIVIRIPVREAPELPSVAGDFTGWMPVPMERQGNEWRYAVNLSPGVYRFAFRSADGEWFVPESVPNRTEDGMGGWVAVLVVP